MSGLLLPRRRSRTARRGGRLVGLGHALPAHRWSQDRLAAELAELWGLEGGELDRWRRIVESSRIESRHGVRPIDAVLHLSTAARMGLFSLEAPPLAESAARRALAASGVAAERITDLVVVTCTGFSAPGVDVELVERLGLDPGVRRLQVGFMGCFGAICGLRAAAGACALDPRAAALVVCVELCTLHLRADRSPQNLVATALFGDAAAAAVVVGERVRTDPSAAAPETGAPLRILPERPLLLTAGRSAMTWTITDAGFAMTLDRRVPEALRCALADSAAAPGAERRRPPASWAVHPGGAAILEAVDAGLGLGGGRGLEHAWSVLRDPGNVSSGSVLLVLERLLAAAAPPPIELLAFGPGLTIERLRLEGAERCDEG